MITWWRSDSISSKTIKISLKSVGDEGRMMCFMSIISGWRSRRRSFISLRIIMASETCSKISLIFLIATHSPVWVSTAARTNPRLPRPITSRIWNRAPFPHSFNNSMSKIFRETSIVLQVPVAAADDDDLRLATALIDAAIAPPFLQRHPHNKRHPSSSTRPPPYEQPGGSGVGLYCRQSRGEMAAMPLRTPLPLRRTRWEVYILNAFVKKPVRILFLQMNLTILNNRTLVF